MKTMKDIKPYLHLYLNAQVQVRKKNDKDREYLIGRVCEVTSGSNHGDWIKVWFDDCHTVTNDTWNELTSNAHHFFINHDEIKLILRRLSDMSEEEKKELEATKALQRPSPVHHVAMLVWTADSFAWALSKSFDLFGLIDSGLAIDTKTVNK